jgi:hypothetical protein
MVYSKREAVTVCKAFMCARELASLDPLALCCIFFKCLNREKISRRKVVPDTENGMNMNIGLVKENNLESCA